jgi:hypothetical protein
MCTADETKFSAGLSGEINEWLKLGDAKVNVGLDTDLAGGFRVFSLSFLLAAASAVCGWLVGFLFGIPRALTRSTHQPAATNGRLPGVRGQLVSRSADDNEVLATRANTNLEDIADWLTKILVGVGLTQLFTIPNYLWRVAGELNTHGFGWDNYGQLLVLALFLYFGPGGFLLGYLVTRTILTKLVEDFARSDEAVKLEDVHSLVRDRAYAIWEQEGRPEGKEREHWERAEAEVEAEDLRSESYVLRIATQMLKNIRCPGPSGKCPAYRLPGGRR